MTAIRVPVALDDTWQCLRRFLTVGVLGTSIDLALYTGLHVLLGAPTLIANTCSYSAGMLNSYVLHRNWTYARRSPKTMGTQFVQFAVVNLVALIMNNVLVLLFTHPFSSLVNHAGMGDMLAKLFATGVCMGWNFLANNFWTFRAPSKGMLR
jgi:putative flippase GtrA